MKRIALEISNLCDVYPIEYRENKVAFFVVMTEDQIDRNIETLKETKDGRRKSKFKVKK